MIQDVYLYGLWTVAITFKYAERHNPYRWYPSSALEIVAPFVEGYDEASARRRYANYQEHYYYLYSEDRSYDKALELRKEKLDKWKQDFLPGHTRIFIVTKPQESQLLSDMKELELDKYLAYESIWAVNKNYVEEGPRIKMYIYHIPKEQ